MMYNVRRYVTAYRLIFVGVKTRRNNTERGYGR